MPLNVETFQATIPSKDGTGDKAVSLIVLQDTKKNEDNTTTVTLELSNESIEGLAQYVDFLIGIFSYYRTLVETYDLKSDRASISQAKSAYNQYIALQAWLPLMLSSVLSQGLEWTSGHDQLWQCLDENAKELANRSLRRQCAHLPVLPLYQLRSQSVTRLLEKLQNNRDSLDGAEIRIVESYFEDTVFYSAPQEEGATEEPTGIEQTKEMLFWGWFALIFNSPAGMPASSQRDFQSRLQNMFLNSRAPEERFARISKILKSSLVSSSVMQWICQESVQRFSGHTFTEIMRADISALEEAAKAKIQLEGLIRTKLEALKTWFDKWIRYCENHWTLGLVEPGVIMLNPLSSIMRDRSVSVRGAAVQENTGYIERGLTAIIDTAAHTYIKAYYWAAIANSSFQYSAGNSTLSVLVASQSTQFWISRTITQYVPQVLLGATVLQASIAYTATTIALGQRNRAYYYFSRWRNDESPYEPFKRILWKKISENIMPWLLLAKDTNTLLNFFTHEAREAQQELSIHLGRVTLVNSILITGAKEFDSVLTEENDRLLYIRTNLQAMVEAAKTVWNISVDQDSVDAIVAGQPAICFSRKALPPLEAGADPTLGRATAALK